jgi:hypothetical protein
MGSHPITTDLLDARTYAVIIGDKMTTLTYAICQHVDDIPQGFNLTAVCSALKFESPEPLELILFASIAFAAAEAGQHEVQILQRSFDGTLLPYSTVYVNTHEPPEDDAVWHPLNLKLELTIVPPAGPTLMCFVVQVDGRIMLEAPLYAVPISRRIM